MRALSIFLIACFVSAVAQAADVPAKKLYQTLGSPTQPKTVVQWNRYHDYAESTKLLQELAKHYPNHCRLQSLGKSVGDREMWVLTIADFAAGDESQRPAFWIDGGIHANEIQSVEVVLYTAWYLLEMHADNELIKRLLRERTFYLLPMMSPDSRDDHFYQPNTTHSPRTGQRPRDDDRDGLVDEDGPEDLDGDGSITLMRVRDPDGKLKPHPDFPAILIPTKEGEPGEYTILGQEGIDNDGDGEVNEDSDGFYDPNRDWGWGWQPPYVQNGAYRYPFSILENRLAADFIASRPNIVGGQSYHNAGGMILRGPGAKEETYDASDVRVYDSLGKKGEEILPGYRYMITGKDLYEVHGGLLDWMHQSRGAYVFTNELFTPFNYFRKSAHGGFFGSPELQAQFDKYVLLGDGFAAWREYEHPLYGKIEVGGTKKNWTRQPPAFLLEEECHRNMAFTVYHADQMPLLRVRSVETKSLGGTLFEITAVVENQRLCPTHSAADRKHRLTPADEVALQLDGGQVVSALISDDRFFLTPREQRRDPATVRLDNLPGNSATHIRWLVEGTGKGSVEVRSIKGGRHAANVEISEPQP